MAGNILSLKADGFKATLLAMKILPAKVQKKLMGAALRSGAKPILQSAQARAPKSTGLLEFSLKIRRPERMKPHEQIVLVAPDVKRVGGHGEKPWKYAHLVELGTKPHRIVPRAERGTEALAFQGRAGLTVVKGVDHPGTEAQPFLRPAFDANVERAETLVAKSLRRGLKREARKLVRQKFGFKK